MWASRALVYQLNSKDKFLSMLCAITSSARLTWPKSIQIWGVGGGRGNTWSSELQNSSLWEQVHKWNNFPWQLLWYTMYETGYISTPAYLYGKHFVFMVHLANTELQLSSCDTTYYANTFIMMHGITIGSKWIDNYMTLKTNRITLCKITAKHYFLQHIMFVSYSCNRL